MIIFEFVVIKITTYTTVSIIRSVIRSLNTQKLARSFLSSVCLKR